MQFNDTTTNLGICQEIDGLCDTTPASYTLANKTRRINNALEQVIGWIINCDGAWQWDDSNNTNLPIGTQTLVAGQSAYTFNDKFLQLLSVEIKDAGGDYNIIKQIDQKEFDDTIPLEEAFETNGLPVYYDLISDDTIKLYPAPSATDVTLVAGLRIKFKRTAHLFAADDTTAVPGFASPFHVILAYMAAIPYCMTYKKDRVSLYEKKVAELKDEIIKHYSRRNQDKRKVATMKQISFR